MICLHILLIQYGNLRRKCNEWIKYHILKITDMPEYTTISNDNLTFQLLKKNDIIFIESWYYLKVVSPYSAHHYRRKSCRCK